MLRIRRRTFTRGLTASTIAVAALLITPAASPPEASAQTVVTRLADLVQTAGDDTRADFGRIRMASIGVDAPLAARRVADTVGTRMPNPYGPGDVAWYDFEHPSFGGAPGAGRNAIVSGHIDYNTLVPHAGVRYRGPGVFERLDDLQPGDVIEVTRGTRTYRYAVSWKRVLPEVSSAWEAILSSRVAVESLTLYTCDGVFDRGRLSYSDRLVVRAELLEGTPNQYNTADAFQGYSVFRSGTTHPAALFRAQRNPVSILFMWHEGQQRWLTYRPGAPTSANTLLGHLRPDSVVVAGIPESGRR